MNFKNLFLRNNNRLGHKIFMAKCPIILPIKWAHFWHSRKKFDFTGFFHQNNFSLLGGHEGAHFKCIFMGNFAMKILRPNLLFLRNKFLKFKFLKSLFVDRFQNFFVISLPWTKISFYLYLFQNCVVRSKDIYNFPKSYYKKILNFEFFIFLH